jgi:hypothetical protein
MKSSDIEDIAINALAQITIMRNEVKNPEHRFYYYLENIEVTLRKMREVNVALNAEINYLNKRLNKF